MLKNAVSNGYSSQVRGWLFIDGVQLGLAQVGPDFCILREPLSSQLPIAEPQQAELTVEVDGDPRTIVVNLSSSHSSSPQKLHFSLVKGSLVEIKQ
jgi:hypothetical protein